MLDLAAVENSYCLIAINHAATIGPCGGRPRPPWGRRWRADLAALWRKAVPLQRSFQHASTVLTGSKQRIRAALQSARKCGLDVSRRQAVYKRYRSENIQMAWVGLNAD